MGRWFVCFLSRYCLRWGAEDCLRQMKMGLRKWGCWEDDTREFSWFKYKVLVNSGVNYCRLALGVSDRLNTFQLGCLLGTSPSNPVGGTALCFREFWRAADVACVWTGFCVSASLCSCRQILNSLSQIGLLRVVFSKRVSSLKEHHLICSPWSSVWFTPGYGEPMDSMLLGVGWMDGWMGL